jgi:hypothetical protein
LAWVGFIKAHLHPALALCTVVPFMPTAPHSEDHERHSEEVIEERDEVEKKFDKVFNYLTEQDNKRCGKAPSPVVQRSSWYELASPTSKAEAEHWTYQDLAALQERMNELSDELKERLELEEAQRDMERLKEESHGMDFDHMTEEQQEKMIMDYVKDNENRAGVASTMQHKLNAGYLFAAYKTMKVKDSQGVEHHQISTLDSFEHSTKIYVDLGLALFAFCNAGIVISSVGAMALLIPLSLLVGKFLGILVMYKISHRMGFKPPLGIHTKHICMIGIIASIGLVVAIFVSDVAFTDEALKNDAKLGAIISAFPCPILCVILMRFIDFSGTPMEDIKDQARAELKAGAFGAITTAHAEASASSPKNSPALKPTRSPALKSKDELFCDQQNSPTVTDDKNA